jgi:hypothetical protein
MASARLLLVSFFVTLLLVPSSLWAAATVNYEGYLYGANVPPFAPHQPVPNGFVIVGTLAPGFTLGQIDSLYGDSAQNVGTDYYGRAVSDGNIRPIGVGTMTDGLGHFAGTGATSDPVGTQIYLFGFTPSAASVSLLATSSDASYLVPASGGTTTIDATLANQFQWGSRFGNGVAMEGMPIPEPSVDHRPGSDGIRRPRRVPMVAMDFAAAGTVPALNADYFEISRRSTARLIASRSFPLSSPLGVSRYMGTFRKRLSLSRNRNGSVPISPRPMPA